MAADNPKITPTAIFLWGLLFISVASFGTLYWFSQRLISAAIENLSFVADLKHDYIENVLMERLADAEVFASYPSLQALLKAEDESQEQTATASHLEPIIENVKEAYGYTSVQVFNASKHRVTLAPGGTLTPEIDGALSQTIADGLPHLVDIHQSETGLTVFGFVQPIFAPHHTTGAISGAVYLEVPTAKTLFQELAQWPLPSASGETLLFRRDGEDILFLSPLRFKPDSGPLTTRIPLADRDLLAAKLLSLNADVQTTGHDYRGAAVIGVGRPIEGTNWVLLAKTDRAEIYRPAQLLAAAIAVISLIGITLFIFLARLAARLQVERSARSEAKLNEKYRVAITNTLDAVLVLDSNGIIIEWNPAAEALLAYLPQELNGKAIAALLARSSPAELAVLMDRLRSAQTSRFIDRWKRKDGALVDIDISVTVVSDSDSGYRFFVSARDITAEKAASRRLEHLNRVLGFLNATNNAIRTLRDIPAILDAACAAAAAVGKFRLVWACIPDGDGPVQPVSAYGESAAYVRDITITTNPSLATSHGPTGTALSTGKLIVVNDFQADPQTAAWHETAKTYGLAASASAPIVVNGTAVAAIMFYAETVDFFDSEVLELIDRVQQNVGLACETANLDERATTAEKRSRVLERRYETIFESSPTAMQLAHIVSGKDLRINKAHQHLFGYEPSDFPTNDAWFEKMYPDATLRNKIVDMWAQDLETARSESHGVTSPLLTLTRKDGTPVIVQGKVTVAGDDVIVAWTDLTEREEQARTLRAGEARFRGMIEQTITGIYVVRDRKIQYANSRFEEISGYCPDELFGRDPLFLLSEDSREALLAARASLESGSMVADFAVRILRKDGETRDVQVHAAQSSWDGHPAIIAMSQDISERKRAEAQIAAYLRQLKSSMHGTLSAVAKMLDFRDPYTAGHERRVGLISAAIGKELGLGEEACEWLNWAGLVHDIGKISVPAELLSKPTRLTALEYEMIKGHAQSGYEILKDIEFPMPVAEIARQHHERMDGSGYPRGLKGEEILQEARILAVADVIESMASHRPYRPGLGIDAALKELDAHRGSFYDPTVVDALLRLIHEKGWQLPK